jgi:hypothetical protein
MNTASILKTKTVGAKVIDLVSYLETDNDRLRQAAAQLTLQNASLRQELEDAQKQEPETPPIKEKS